MQAASSEAVSCSSGDVYRGTRQMQQSATGRVYIRWAQRQANSSTDQVGPSVAFLLFLPPPSSPRKNFILKSSPQLNMFSFFTLHCIREMDAADIHAPAKACCYNPFGISLNCVDVTGIHGKYCFSACEINSVRLDDTLSCIYLGVDAGRLLWAHQTSVTW